MEKSILEFLRKEVKKQLSEVKIEPVKENLESSGISVDDLQDQLRDAAQSIMTSPPDDPAVLLAIINMINSAKS